MGETIVPFLVGIAIVIFVIILLARCIKVVPQAQAWIIETFDKGLHQSTLMRTGIKTTFNHLPS